jgi:carbon storage regulator
MLILTRRNGESICIGADVQVTVLAHRGNQVRIGIVAPRTVTVLRAELLNSSVPHGCDKTAALAAEPIC